MASWVGSQTRNGFGDTEFYNENNENRVTGTAGASKSSVQRWTQETNTRGLMRCFAPHLNAVSTMSYMDNDTWENSNDN